MASEFIWVSQIVANQIIVKSKMKIRNIYAKKYNHYIFIQENIQ